MSKSVLVQRGHWAPRERGFETGTGARGEQEVVGVIAARLVNLLASDPRFAARAIPGAIPADVKTGAYRVDAFLSLHCDGNTNPGRKGWGVGYPDGAVNKRLADLIAAEIDKFHPSRQIRDNYTRNMSGYYGWSRVPTPGPEVLVEHGFSSSPEEKRWMLDNAGLLARAEYVALCRFFGFRPQGRDSGERKSRLRAFILAAKAVGWPWGRLKQTAEWLEWKRSGGK